MKRALVTLALLVMPSLARADEPKTEPKKEPITRPIELRFDWRIDGPVLGALAVTTVGFRLIRDDLEPSYCRICDGDGPGEVNAVDRWFRDALVRRDTHPANVTSYVLAFGAAPLSGAALSVLAAVADERGDEAAADVAMVAEGGFAAMMTTQVLEAITLRERPYVHAMSDPDVRRAEIAKTGAFHSFPAGHVVETFGIAAASGMVASMRGYRLAPLVWIAGMTIGAATAYTRIAADRHYFTDTLAGAAIGTVVGGAIPFFFHRPRTRMPALVAQPVRGGVAFSAGWTL
ncbi:MAG: phosphatase PAP2 family protein [Labilithrix sp.]|nr:phosphatase PAP2 family protein [Labilithrix sp.]MCW5815626.1 phosphatase PAP2 family protein [Labilithrix sp.]